MEDKNEFENLFFEINNQKNLELIIEESEIFEYPEIEINIFDLILFSKKLKNPHLMKKIHTLIQITIFQDKFVSHFIRNFETYMKNTDIDLLDKISFLNLVLKFNELWICLLKYYEKNPKEYFFDFLLVFIENQILSETLFSLLLKYLLKNFHSEKLIHFFLEYKNFYFDLINIQIIFQELFLKNISEKTSQIEAFLVNCYNNFFKFIKISSLILSLKNEIEVSDDFEKDVFPFYKFIIDLKMKNNKTYNEKEKLLKEILEIIINEEENSKKKNQDSQKLNNEKNPVLKFLKNYTNSFEFIKIINISLHYEIVTNPKHLFYYTNLEIIFSLLDEKKKFMKYYYLFNFIRKISARNFILNDLVDFKINEFGFTFKEINNYSVDKKNSSIVNYRAFFNFDFFGVLNEFICDNFYFSIKQDNFFKENKLKKYHNTLLGSINIIIENCEIVLNEFHYQILIYFEKEKNYDILFNMVKKLFKIEDKIIKVFLEQLVGCEKIFIYDENTHYLKLNNQFLQKNEFLDFYSNSFNYIILKHKIAKKKKDKIKNRFSQISIEAFIVRILKKQKQLNINELYKKILVFNKKFDEEEFSKIIEKLKNKDLIENLDDNTLKISF